jgi:hypothetical protein
MLARAPILVVRPWAAPAVLVAACLAVCPQAHADEAEVRLVAPACSSPLTVLVVDLVVEVASPGPQVVGLQALLQYNRDVLRFLEFEEGDAPYVVPIWASEDPDAGTVDVAVGFDPAADRSQAPSAVAKRLRFEVLAAPQCASAGLIGFREDPPFRTLLTEIGGFPVDPTLTVLGPLTVSAPPAIEQPADLVLVPTLGMDCVWSALESPAATSACGTPPVVTFARSDGASSLLAPFCRIRSPVTITWTATDACGQGSSVSQLITVPGLAADLNQDTLVDAVDLATVLAAWGTSGGVGDINGDGFTDGKDLSEVLGRWNDWGR